MRVAATKLSWRRALSHSSPTTLAPTRLRGAVEGEPVLGEFLAAEELVIGILDPSCAQHLVGEVVHVLQNGEPGYQPRRQERTAGVIIMGRAAVVLKKAQSIARASFASG